MRRLAATTVVFALVGMMALGPGAAGAVPTESGTAGLQAAMDREDRAGMPTAALDTSWLPVPPRPGVVMQAERLESEPVAKGPVAAATHTRLPIAGFTYFIGEDGRLHVRGVVYNVNDVPVGDSDVAVTQYNSAGSVLKREYLRLASPPSVYSYGPKTTYPADFSVFGGGVAIAQGIAAFTVEVFGHEDDGLPVTLPTSSSKSHAGGDHRLVSAYAWNPSALVPGACESRLQIIEWSGTDGQVIDVTAPGCTAPDARTYTAQEIAQITFGRDWSYSDANHDVWFTATRDGTPVSTELTRVAGADRVSTALEASRRSFESSSATTVVVAAANSFADALSAAALAGAYDSPILLSGPAGLREDVADELGRLGAENAIIVGGPKAVPLVVEQDLQASLGASGTVTRIAGSSRYGTSAMVCSEVASVVGTDVLAAFVVRGDKFADALAASPFAYSQVMPILLVRPAQAPPEVVGASADAGVQSLVVVGGEGAVSDDCADSFYAGWERIAGTSRYSTAALVALYGYDAGWTDMALVGLASGQSYADGLAGGAAIGHEGGCLLLTRKAHLSYETGVLFAYESDKLSEVRVLGGSGAVSDLTMRTTSRMCP